VPGVAPTACWSRQRVLGEGISWSQNTFQFGLRISHQAGKNDKQNVQHGCARANACKRLEVVLLTALKAASYSKRVVEVCVVHQISQWALGPCSFLARGSILGGAHLDSIYARGNSDLELICAWARANNLISLSLSLSLSLSELAFTPNSYCDRPDRKSSRYIFVLCVQAIVKLVCLMCVRNVNFASVIGLIAVSLVCQRPAMRSILNMPFSNGCIFTYKCLVIGLITRVQHTSTKKARFADRSDRCDQRL